MNPIRILIVDDQALFREGLRAVLSAQPDFEIVGEAADGVEAVALANEFEPHVILMDLRMPRLGGVQATQNIRAAHPTAQVIVLTTFDDAEEVFDALRAGAAGYLLKDASPEKLGDAIRAAARGESFLQPSIAAKVVAEFNRLSQSRPARMRTVLREPLSDRECQVLQKLAEGKSNKEIANGLSLAEGTVKNHLSNIFGKLGVLDRTQAALMARELGLL
jgi:DNA-binding NarL/FixJ family response regulator